ncbi:MAG: hypothetical protein WBV06_20695 [Acidimicrobiia bacterium]
MSRGREGMGKRERERRRVQRQEAKRLRRETIASETEVIDNAVEARLMDEFRVLSEGHAAGRVPELAYKRERQRIFLELGIPDTDG